MSARQVCWLAVVVALMFVSQQAIEAAASMKPPAFADDEKQIKKALIVPTTSAELKHGEQDILVIWTAPQGGGRVYSFFSVYFRDGSRWRRVAYGMLDYATDVRATIVDHTLKIEGLLPGREKEWEERISLDLS